MIHPYVNIGSKRHKINIIPDYILEINGKPMVVLDAKSPSTRLEKTEHSEQAYSYSIHPEVRAKVYGLCNGKEWIFWDIDKLDPILQVKTEELIKDISKLEKILTPKNLIFPEMRDFRPDFGLRCKKLNLAMDAIQYFIANPISSIMKVEDGLYCITLEMPLGDENLAITYDFNQLMFEKLIDCFPLETQKLIKSMLSRQPFIAHGFEEVYVSITGKFGEVTKGQYEEFIPIIVSDVSLISMEIVDTLKEIESS